MSTDHKNYEPLTSSEIDEIVDAIVSKLKINPLAQEPVAEYEAELKRASKYGAQEQFREAIYTSLFGLLDENSSKWAGEVPQNTSEYFRDPELPQQLIDGILSKDYDSLMELLKSRYVESLQDSFPLIGTPSKDVVDDKFHVFMLTTLISLAALYTK